jgi:hypothetical protein
MGGDDDLEVTRRLVPVAAPACWIGVCVKVVPAAAREDGGGIVHTPDPYLAAAWPPAASGFTRWPEAVVIGSPTSTRALAELFRQLPPASRLHLATLDDVDAALAAEILLVADRNLEPYQREAIARFADAARERTRAAIASRYSDRDPGFERLRACLFGGAEEAGG